MAHPEQVGFWRTVFEAACSSIERLRGWPRQRPDPPQRPPERGVLNQTSSAGEPWVYTLLAARL